MLVSPRGSEAFSKVFTGYRAEFSAIFAAVLDLVLELMVLVIRLLFSLGNIRAVTAAWNEAVPGKRRKSKRKGRRGD